MMIFLVTSDDEDIVAWSSDEETARGYVDTVFEDSLEQYVEDYIGRDIEDMTPEEIAYASLGVDTGLAICPIDFDFDNPDDSMIYNLFDDEFSADEIMDFVQESRCLDDVVCYEELDFWSGEYAS